MKKITKVVTGIGSSLSAFALGATNAAAQVVTKPEWAIGPSGNADAGEVVGNILTNVLNIVFAVGVIIALFFLIWGAFSWITSGGDKTKTADARNRIIAAVVGLILLAAVWALLSLVLSVIYGGARDVGSVINDNLSLQ